MADTFLLGADDGSTVGEALEVLRVSHSVSIMVSETEMHLDMMMDQYLD